MEEKISFFLMGYKGFKVLEYMISNFRNNIAFVVSSKDASVQNDYFAEIQELSTINNVEFYDKKDTPKITTNYAIAISWRWLIDTKSTLIVLHDSLLPRYRGFNPLVTALINGDKTVGVTALLASKDYDKGNILAQSSIEISYPIKIKQVIEEISICYIQLVHTVLANLNKPEFMLGREQKEELATYSIWRNQEDYKIDWNKDSEAIKRFIDAVSFPYAGASTFLNGKDEIRVLEVELVDDVFVEDRSRQIGKVIFMEDAKPTIICAKGLLRITKMLDSSENIYLFKNFRTKLI